MNRTDFDKLARALVDAVQPYLDADADPRMVLAAFGCALTWVVVHMDSTCDHLVQQALDSMVLKIMAEAGKACEAPPLQ